MADHNRVTKWAVPVKAAGHRDLELRDLRFQGNELVLKVVSEADALEWTFEFLEVQAFRTTAEECMNPLVEKLPFDAACFEIENSPWIDALGRGTVRFLEDSHHFVVCCYDEIVEVVAWSCTVRATSQP
jgi:hypothetical protein